MSAQSNFQNNVIEKITKQNALAAALGTVFWCIPILVLWVFIYELKPAAGAVMLWLSGALIGLAVRFHGRGYERLFSVIGFVSHACIVLLAWDFQIVVGGNVLPVILIGVYVLGAWSAAYLSRINISMHDYKAFDAYFACPDYIQQKKLKNRWFVVLPLLLVLTFVVGYIIAIAVLIFQEVQYMENEKNQQAARAAEFRDKHINTSDEALAAISQHKALTYAFAYYSGRQFDVQGRYLGNYPQDSYQAQLILRYLAEQKSNPRAQFILGKILNSKTGDALITQAEEGGDTFARLYSIYEFGCYMDAKKGRQLLTSFAKNIEEQSVKIDIYGMLSDDFNDHCQVLDDTEFDYRYIKDYQFKQ
ncbi:hypothetical protein [uncultured Pseudoalteromonas sp.]|uniref:hypothetical protein n=1 Tax=uncultured Pseudoalteromonas sp. TaxID=114053 RepID=UPI0030D8E616